MKVVRMYSPKKIGHIRKTELESFLETEKPQICIPKSGNILLIHIQGHRYLFCIGRLIISSVSGIWWKR